jgi:hypothetical protein
LQESYETFLKKSIDTLKGFVQDISMFKSTDLYKIVKNEEVEQHLEEELKNLIDKLRDPKYIQAITKLSDICSKQNYLYN